MDKLHSVWRKVKVGEVGSTATRHIAISMLDLIDFQDIEFYYRAM